MKQLILRHHVAEPGAEPTVEVVYQQSPTHQGQFSGAVPFTFVFTDTDRELLRWYLEEYLLCPLAVYQQRAQEAEAAMQRIGEGLFRACFSSEKAALYYGRVRDSLPETRIVVQANTAQGIALPWELLADPLLSYAYLAYEAAAFVRGEADLTRAPLALQGETLRVLLVISRPHGEDDVPFQSVARHLLAAFQTERDRVSVEVLRPATFAELSKRVLRKPGYYHVLHFDGHGNYRPSGAPESLLYGDAGGELSFEDRSVTGAELGQVLAAGKVPLVLLNACRSGMVRAEDNAVSLGNELLRSGACGVLAMSYSVYVQTAVAFMRDLYENLREGEDLAGAHKKAVAALKNTPIRKSALGTEERLLDWMVPVLFEAVPVTPLPKLTHFRPSEQATERKIPEVNVPSSPFYGFFGRDTVVQQLEKVFQAGTVALLWGMAGVGKTTTATEFARWWGSTGELEGPIFFTSFEIHKTCEQVVGEIGRSLQPFFKQSGIEWEIQTKEQQYQLVLDFLVRYPCFLIWDNFEPVSGFPTGTPSVWTADKQAELRAFLMALHGQKAKTKVLVTSRRESEALLSEFATVSLSGLTLFEALELAGAILAQKGMDATAIRKLPKFNALLKFLNGNPLAIQVILPLLKDGIQPEALLEKLQAGTLKLPESDTVEQGRDKSLTASLSYRFESLPPEDTARLSVLGLFQGFVDAAVLGAISEDKDSPPVLQGLTAEDWKRILSMAAEIGLLRSVGEGYYTIHPALPWFFHELLVSTFGDSRSALEKIFVRIYGSYGEWLDNLFRSKPQFAMSLLSDEEPNLLYALRLSLAQQQDGFTSGILYGVQQLWTMQGRWEEFNRLLTGIENNVQMEDGEPIVDREFLWASVLGMRSRIAGYRREFNTEKNIHFRLKQYYEKSGDERNLAVALHRLGMIAQERRDFTEAEKWYRESLAIKQRIGNDHGVAITLHQLGMIAEERRDFTEAEKWYRESLAIK